MTKEEIMAMETGDGLDAMIDKEIFGGDGCPHDLYSTDISSAWKVVEKLRSMEDGEGNSLLCCLTIHSDYDFCWDIRWCYSELSNRNDGHKKHLLPTCYYEFPEAICKAALLILEGKKQ